MGRRTWRLTRAGIRLTETVKSKIRKVGSAHSGRVGKARNGVDVYHFARTEGSGEQGLERLNRPHATSLRVGLRRASPTSPRTQGRTSCTAVSASARCGPPARAQRTAMPAKMAPTPAPGCDAPIKGAGCWPASYPPRDAVCTSRGMSSRRGEVSNRRPAARSAGPSGTAPLTTVANRLYFKKRSLTHNRACRAVAGPLAGLFINPYT